MNALNGAVNRCLYLDQNHQLTVREKPVPVPGPGTALVRIAANGICGSDLHFFKEGRLGNFVVDRPYIPGHEASGEIVSLGSGVRDLAVGDRVVIEPGIPCGHCAWCRAGRYNLCPDVVFLSAPPTDGTLCDYLVVRADALWRMPEALSFQDAALAEPAAVAVHAVRRARFAPGASALVVGAGPIGLMVAQAFRAAGGGEVVCRDLIEKRLQAAEQLGARRAGLDDKVEADVVFDTSGSAKACAGLFAAARPGGCVVQVGWPAGNLVSMNIADFLDRELDYVAVNRYANAFPAALQWLGDGRIQTGPLVTHIFSFEQSPEAFAFSAQHPADVIKTVILNQ
ncbi:MAG: alcohol dehydrogenase catalytic domain-containing protein [Clostridiaceae bacterium]|jgi:L-iditol 2-dehydrogenase|nr:alcohol dehydrogenase catalytic domain-containing protein [Clostridiaceae bacterium]